LKLEHVEDALRHRLMGHFPCDMARRAETQMPPGSAKPSRRRAAIIWAMGC